MKVLAYRKGKEPVIEEMEEGLEAMQEFVGGYIEMVPVTGKLMLVCNEEGKIMKLPPNLPLPNGDVVHGDIFFIRDNKEGETVDIREKDVKKIREILKF